MIKKKRWDIWALSAIVIFGLLILVTVYPLGCLLVTAFKGADGTFSLQHFTTFFNKPYYYTTIANSFKIAAATSILTTAIGLVFSYFYSFFQLRGRKVLFITCLLCGMSAPFIGAYSWIFLFGNGGIVTKFLKETFSISLGSIYGFKGIVIVQVSRMFPLVVLYMNGAFRNIDASLLEASENLGVSGFKRFLRVTLVLVMPTLLAAFLVVFLRSLADFGTPLVIGRGYTTFPLLIYEQYTSENAGGSYGFAAAVSVISVLVTLAVYLLQRFVNGRFRFTINASRHIVQKKAKGLGGALMHLYCYGIILFSMLPQFYITYLSFCNYKNSTRKPGYSFDNYIYAWTKRYMSTATQNTLILGVCTLAVVVLLSIFISYLVVRRKNTLTKTIDSIAMVPYVIPGLVIGVSLVIAFNNSRIALTGTLLIMMIALTIRTMPNTLRSTTAALQQIPMYTEEASLSLGASKMKTFFRITVPMMKNGIVAGAVLTWTSIITEVASSLILYNNKTITLTVGTYKVIQSMYGTGAAYATVETLFVVLSLILYVMISKEEDVRL